MKIEIRLLGSLPKVVFGRFCSRSESRISKIRNPTMGVASESRISKIRNPTMGVASKSRISKIQNPTMGVASKSRIWIIWQSESVILRTFLMLLFDNQCHRIRHSGSLPKVVFRFFELTKIFVSTLFDTFRTLTVMTINKTCIQ